MEFSDRRGLKDAAKAALEQASCDPKKLILIHTGAQLALSLVLNLISTLLQQQIDSTQGLSGLGLASVLSTIQMVLSLGQSLVLPIWQMGLVMTMLNISRGKAASANTLLDGFRRFGPALRLTLLHSGLIMGAMVAAVYLGVLLYMMMPIPESMEAILMQPEAATDPAVLLSLGPVLLPFVGLMLLLFLVMVVPVIYRYRMADHFLMDHPNAGALIALHMSQRMLFRKRLELFKLDLHFWWYYVLEYLASLILFGDVLLLSLGISLPLSPTALSYVVFVLYALCTLALHWFAKDHLETTYAKAYDALLQDLPPMPGTPKPQTEQ